MLWKAPGKRAEQPDEARVGELRLFPIIGFDRCDSVSSLLSRGKLEEAAELVPDRCWVASTPLYG